MSVTDRSVDGCITGSSDWVSRQVPGGGDRRRCGQRWARRCCKGRPGAANGSACADRLSGQGNGGRLLTVELLITITIGSPLGLPTVIFDNLNPSPVDGRGRKPPGVHRWVNIADPADLVALPRHLAPRFDGIDDHQEITAGAFFIHKTDRYLQTDAVRRAVCDQLRHRKPTSADPAMPDPSGPQSAAPPVRADDAGLHATNRETYRSPIGSSRNRFQPRKWSRASDSSRHAATVRKGQGPMFTRPSAIRAAVAVSGIAWVWSWYTMYLEIHRWRHVTRSFRFNPGPPIPGTSIRPKPGRPLKALYACSVGAPVVFVGTAVAGIVRAHRNPSAR
jgi:hypothetical protein